MLLLGSREERNIIKQQSVQGAGGQMLQLLAGAVQHNALERRDLALDIDSHMVAPLHTSVMNFTHLL